MKKLLLLPTAVVLVGCVMPQPPSQVYSDPAPTDPETKIKAWMAANLKDPDSVKAYAYEGLARLNNGKYRASAVWNAKNSYGAYTGVIRHYFMFNGDNIEMHVSQTEIDRLNR